MTLALTSTFCALDFISNCGVTVIISEHADKASSTGRNRTNRGALMAHLQKQDSRDIAGRQAEHSPAIAADHEMDQIRAIRRHFPRL
ncbi:MAG: hypothetical protein A2040_06625 [Rhodocyclales bacterium GWA2_65_19]|nr:MAG: hypothetical protein A2040_06625 [Rhodocyclales bacterium GWA2_65_19]